MPRRRKTHYGEGSVYESPPGSGRWFAEVFDGHGKSIRRRANSRDEAEAKRQELVRRRDGGLHVQGATQTLETFVNVWWERAVKEKGLAPKTLDDYRKTIARYLLPDWGTPNEIRDAIMGHGKKGIAGTMPTQRSSQCVRRSRNMSSYSEHKQHNGNGGTKVHNPSQNLSQCTEIAI